MPSRDLAYIESPYEHAHEPETTRKQNNCAEAACR